jgi:glycosyltransferase involved in cell wall biosynthesis
MNQARVAVVVSHPIQHFCPQYVSWAGIDVASLRVFFGSTHGLQPYRDKHFGRVVQWSGISLDFPHEFLCRDEPSDSIGSVPAGVLHRKLNEFNPDMVVVYGYTQPISRHALQWATRSGAAVAMIADSELRATRALTTKLLKRFILPRLFRGVAVFLTVGDANEAYYRHYGVSDQYMVRCPFPIDVLHYESALANAASIRRRVREALGVPQDNRVALMVGKLVPWKSQADLVRAALMMGNQRADVTVILAGSGQDEGTLREMARQTGARVVLPGFVPPNELAGLYCAADVYVHSSAREPHSLAISEAIYCGLSAVVSHRCGSYGPSDDVRPGLNGFVYRHGDVAYLAHLLGVLFSNEQLSADMRSASSAIAQAQQSVAHGTGFRQALRLLRLGSG